MGKYISGRNSEVEDLLYDGIDDIIEEFAPFLRNESGAQNSYSSNVGYRNTVRGRLHKQFMDNIWPGIEKQLDSYTEESDKMIDDLTEQVKEQTDHIKDLLERLEELEHHVTELQEENQLFREGKDGMVYGKSFGV